MDNFERNHQLKKDINKLIKKNLPKFITNQVAVSITEIKHICIVNKCTCNKNKYYKEK